MRITGKATITTEQTTDVICDRCGESCKSVDGDVSAVPIDVLGHFGSRRFEDCHRYHLDLCENCAFELARSFKYPPEVRFVGPWGNGDGAPEITWETTLARNEKK
jgi:hypothetical protein